ncbi:MAG TPA: prepilin peptidase [Devosiaceae bacterium]
MLNTVALLIFPLLMALAASSDLLTMRISNRLVLTLVGGFVLMAILVNMSAQEFAMHVAAAVVVLIVAFSFFAMRWIGGGDAKLAAATTLWLGFGVTLPYLVYAALLGGALTLLILAVRRWPLHGALARIEWIDRLHNHKSGVPYGIALAASGLITYSDTGIFHHFAG